MFRVLDFRTVHPYKQVGLIFNGFGGKKEMDKKPLARVLAFGTFLLLMATENEASWFREFSKRRVTSQRVRAEAHVGDIIVRVTSERFHYGLVVAPPKEAIVEVLEENGLLNIHANDERFRPKVHDRIEFLTYEWCEVFVATFGGGTSDDRCEKLLAPGESEAANPAPQ